VPAPLGKGLRLAHNDFLCHLLDSLILLHALLLSKGVLHQSTGVACGLSSLGDLLQLVVPEQKRAPVLQQHVEGQVLGVAPFSTDRARKSSPLQATTRVANPYFRADLSLFCPHPLPPLSPPAGLLLAAPLHKCARLGSGAGFVYTALETATTPPGVLRLPLCSGAVALLPFLRLAY